MVRAAGRAANLAHELFFLLLAAIHLLLCLLLRRLHPAVRQRSMRMHAMYHMINHDHVGALNRVIADFAQRDQARTNNPLPTQTASLNLGPEKEAKALP